MPERREHSSVSLLSNNPWPQTLRACWMRVCVLACTCMLAKEACGASRILSLSFCCAALSAARSLPGALLSATGLSDELDSASDRRQSELLDYTQLWVRKNRPKKKAQRHTVFTLQAVEINLDYFIDLMFYVGVHIGFKSPISVSPMLLWHAQMNHKAPRSNPQVCSLKVSLIGECVSR